MNLLRSVALGGLLACAARPAPMPATVPSSTPAAPPVVVTLLPYP